MKSGGAMESAANEIKRAVQGAIKSSGRYPFLFIGSGLSRRYMSAPGWEELLRRVCAETLDDPFAFLRYLNRARTEAQGSGMRSEYPLVASLMENDVNDALLSDKRLADFRALYFNEIDTGSSPMKLYIAQLLSGLEISGYEEERALLRRAGREKVSGVITTNYDSLCDSLFPTFKVYVGEDDLLFSDPCFAREVYKIHGSVAQPDGMVLNEADYRAFEDKEKYLAAKLLTIFVEYPVIFLGYSIQDENIQRILSSIARCLGPSRIGVLRSRLIFVQYSPSNAGEVSSLTMSFDGQMLSMTRVETDDLTPIFDAIAVSRRLYDTRFISEMRGSIYRIAERVDPASDVITAGLRPVLDSLEPDQKVIIGLGVSGSKVGKPLHAYDLFEDVLSDREKYSCDFVLENYIEELLRHVAGALPVFKYVSGASMAISPEKFPKLCDLIDSRRCLADFRNASYNKRLAGQRERFSGHLSVGGLIGELGEERAYKFMWILEEDDIDLGQLGRYLSSRLAADGDDARKPGGVLRDSEFKRMVRVYDFLRYRKSPDLSH